MSKKTQTPKATSVPLENYVQTILGAVNSWEVQNTPEQIERQVHEELNKQKTEIAYSLIGLTTKWGKLEIDTSKNGDFSLKQEVTAASEKALKEFLVDFPKLEISTKHKAQITKQMQEMFENSIHSRLYNLVNARITQMAEQILQDLMQAPDIESLINFRKFIKGVPNEN